MPTISYRLINSTKIKGRTCTTCADPIHIGDSCIRMYGAAFEGRRDKKYELFKCVFCATVDQYDAAMQGQKKRRAAQRRQRAKKMLAKFGEFPPSEEPKQEAIDFDNFCPF